ncbi:MAG TPA: type I-E CRISPR-associated protein Cse1/CasA [Herpetosiphonaceae bacterium]
MTQPLSPPAVASFNLWREPWIRVLDRNGGRRTLSIEEVLLQAHALKAFYDPSPLTVAGVHRLLAAILQAIYAPRDLAAIGDVLDEPQFDAARIRAFGEQFGERFDLFHPIAPFLQTGDVPLVGWRKPERPKGKQAAANDQGSVFEQDTAEQPAAAVPSKIEPKTIAYLLEEVPAGTNRTHFRHVTDDDHHLCPACCARSLITIPAFAKSGGAGIKPSINGVPPVYLLPVGDTLFHSLTLSLVAKNYRPAVVDETRQTAAWDGATTVPRSGELTAVGYLESLTFPARRVRLFPAFDAGPCTQCGQVSPIRVKEMLYEMGWSRPKQAPLWKDPFVAYRKPAKAKADEAPTPLRPGQGKALWRDYSSLFLADADLQPGLVRQMTGLIEQGIVAPNQRVRFRCIGMKTDGKAKVFEWLDDALNVPTALLRDERGAAAVREALSRAEEVARTIRFIFTRHMNPERGGKQEHFLGIRARMDDDYWTALALPFRDLINTAATMEAVDRARDTWARIILEHAQRAFDAALEQLGDRADMLRRRVEAHTHCRNVLFKHRRDWSLE